MAHVIFILDSGFYFGQSIGQTGKPYAYATPELAQRAVEDLCICTDSKPERFKILDEAEVEKKAS